jgi:hypothetical protein
LGSVNNFMILLGNSTGNFESWSELLLTDLIGHTALEPQFIHSSFVSLDRSILVMPGFQKIVSGKLWVE